MSIQDFLLLKLPATYPIETKKKRLTIHLGSIRSGQRRDPLESSPSQPPSRWVRSRCDTKGGSREAMCAAKICKSGKVAPTGRKNTVTICDR